MWEEVEPLTEEERQQLLHDTHRWQTFCKQRNQVISDLALCVASSLIQHPQSFNRFQVNDTRTPEELEAERAMVKQLAKVYKQSKQLKKQNKKRHHAPAATQVNTEEVMSLRG